MSQPRSADAVPGAPAAAVPGAPAAQRTVSPALAPRNRRVAWQLIALAAIPAVLALVLTGLWVTNMTRSAEAYGQVGRLAALSQQVNGLAQAMADERSDTAAFIAGGRPAADLPALHRQYVITDSRAARVRWLVSQLGHGYPAQTRAGAAQVLASIAKLPGLRRQAAQSQASALAVITGYSAAASSLFPVNDDVADLSGNSTLSSSARAVGSLSRMIDHASQQQAILHVALAGGRFGPGALTALTAAQARQASDLASFRNSATAQESWALAETLTRPPARQAQAVEQRAIAAGDGVLALGPQASQQWSAGMSYTVGWMGQAERQLAGWIPADAQGLQRSTTQSALITGGTVLGVLALALLGIVFAARSMARRQRRHEIAVPEDTEAPLPVSAGAVSAGFLWRNHSLQERLLRLIDSSELNEDDPERLAKLFEIDHLATRIWRNSDSALVLAGHETPNLAEPLALVDVLRAAASEIEEYSRVLLDVQQGVRVSGSAATDTVHLLAELLENAATFSPETTPVMASAHALVGGGSLIAITDGGTGMSEEELTQLNWQLANPSPADMPAAQHMGLRAAALLAARHGITVTLSSLQDGGTTAEVYLPAALISLDAERGGWRRRAGQAPLASAREEADAGVADLPFSVLRFASGPEPPLGPEADMPEPPLGPEAGVPEAVPALLSAPPPSPAPATSTGVAEPEPVDAEPVDGPPIFESIRSGYVHAFGRDLLRFSEDQAGQPPAGRPARPPASWGDGNGRAVAGHPAVPRPALSEPPQRIPQPDQPRGAAADQENGQDPVVESAELAWRKLASFQRGSRRARTVARMNRSAKQPERDG